MAPIFPAICAEKRSSLPAAFNIYSDIELFKKEKEHKRKKKSRSRERSTSSPLQDGQKLMRKKEYSSGLKMRRAKALTRRKNIEKEQLHFSELKANSANEKERLRELFSIYAVQHGNSYRKPTNILRPQFPNLLKPNTHLEKKKISSSSREVVLPYIGSTSGRGNNEDRK